ncbi:MAG TPA: tannase/feruloyl esterase family alpha/beta hydrolase [Verrucomicrobiae bacterium]|nr:tannase/feruloyl esterase family alpha/beta hydrolase [Verrucomicrobiae bacterium]
MKRSIFLCLVVWYGVACVCGQSTKHLNLEDLRHLRLPDVVLESATSMAPDLQKNPHAAAYVVAKGVIGGNIRFELLLPDAWNGRFVMGGGGGFVGSVQNSAAYSVNRGFATVGTDTGHEWQPGYMAGWAFNNLEAQVDFGYLAVHRTAEVAKAVIRSYYGSEAAYCYFTGCSRGGGQAMMEAQRYPKDFDGIVAGAPAFDWPGLAANAVAIQKVLYPHPEHLDQTALDREALKKLQQAILEQCDAQDGLKDGVVQDPPSAHFDLSKVAGLTDEQRTAIEAIYAGANNAKGPIYPGYTPGAECDPDQWIAWIVGPAPGLDHAPDLMFAFGTQIFKYLVFNNPDWNYSTYDFSNFATDTRLAASYLNATNVDLSGFEQRKGKLIMWHGWADPALPPQATVDYYRQVQTRDPNASEYCRLFMVPGCLHCGGGPGASDVDWLAVIGDWVERGIAPDRVIATKTGHGKTEVSRPLYCYPTTAIYNGSGDPASADSFVAKRVSATAH